MIRKYSVFAVLFLAMVIRGEGVREAQASSGGKVLSRAILYVNDPSNQGGFPVNYAEIIVLQSGKIRYLGCGVDSNHLPTTDAALADLANGGSCVSIGSLPNTSSDQQLSRMVHQANGDRYIFLGSHQGVESIDSQETHEQLAFSTSFTMLFDPADAGSIKLQMASINYIAGQNPRTLTRQVNELRAYEAQIQYPAIHESPSEQ